jgi:hypothetical protein
MEDQENNPLRDKYSTTVLLAAMPKYFISEYLHPNCSFERRGP